MKITVAILDSEIKFLREQASRLRDLAGRPGGGRWAEQNAGKMDEIIVTLTDVRRDLQMTTMNGKRLEARPDREARESDE